MAGWLDLSPPDNVVFSATTPAILRLDVGGLLLNPGTVKINDVIIATTVFGAITSLSHQYTLTIDQPGISVSPQHYIVTPTAGWLTDPVTVWISGDVAGPTYTQQRTFTVGEGYVSDHTTTALGRMLQQFEGSGDLRALASSYVDQVQALEDVAVRLLHDRNVNTATGHRLDGLGQIAGVTRSGLGDEDYRLQIRAELAVLTSQGSIEDLIAVLRLLLGLPASTEIQIDEYFPKSIYMRVKDFVMSEDPVIVTAFLRRAVSAATNLQFIYTTVEADDDDLFRFSDTNGTSETSSSHGYSNGLYTGAK